MNGLVELVETLLNYGGHFAICYVKVSTQSVNCAWSIGRATDMHFFHCFCTRAVQLTATTSLMAQSKKSWFGEKSHKWITVITETSKQIMSCIGSFSHSLNVSSLAGDAGIENLKKKDPIQLIICFDVSVITVIHLWDFSPNHDFLIVPLKKLLQSVAQRACKNSEKVHVSGAPNTPRTINRLGWYFNIKNGEVSPITQQSFNQFHQTVHELFKF